MASISVQRERLYLLATLPPRPTAADPAPQGPWRQQRIALRLDRTPANLKVAQRRLAELEKQLASETFDWGFWIGEGEQKVVRWREAIEVLYRHKVVLGTVKESTWRAYNSLLRQLDPVEPCTTATIEKALMRYPREARSYRHLHQLLSNIARLIGVPFPVVPQPTYERAKEVMVPDDDEIVAVVERADPVVGWYLGMMATYGLRPHEVEGAKPLGRGRLLAAEDTKTGGRTVVACPPEWVERFRLEEARTRGTNPRGDGQWRVGIAQWLWHDLKRMGVAWRPYALRHAYAGRLWRTGGSRLDLFTAARLMGHSPMLHARTYRAHVDPHTIADAAERALFGG